MGRAPWRDERGDPAPRTAGRPSTAQIGALAQMTPARELFDRLQPITPSCPAWLYLETRGIPGAVIGAHQDQLRYCEADVPGRPLGEHALAALIRDAATGEVIAFQLSFCDPRGNKVARTKQHPPKITRLLRRRGSLDGLFVLGELAPGCKIHFIEGRAEKALALAAAGYLPVVGFGGRQVLGRQALPPGIISAVVVPDQRPAISMGTDMLRDTRRAGAHDADYARGVARLEHAGLSVLVAPDPPPCEHSCKDADDVAREHGFGTLQDIVNAAQPPEPSVEGEALKIALMPDRAARDQALHKAAKELGVGFKALVDKVQRLRRGVLKQEQEELVTSAPTGMISRQPPFVVIRREYKTRQGQVRMPGVYFEQTDPDGSTTLSWICSLLEVVGLNRSIDSEDWGILLRITDSDNVVHEWPMPASLLAGRGDEMRAELLGLGLQVSPTKQARDRLAEYIQTWRTDIRYRCVDRLGWHDDTFVLPRQVFGSASFGDEVLFQHQHARDIPRFEQAGTLDGWQAEVAQPAIGNDRLVLALSTAFAGPLVRPIGEESGGAHLWGPSSCGKTTALRCACSVWGIAHASWRASDNALEAVAAAACDGLLPLDETGQAAPRVLAAAAYMLAAQMGKARTSRAANRNRAILRWVLLFLSTGELPLTTTLTSAGLSAQAGQQVRMIELPADAGAGHGLFQDLHGEPGGDAFAKRLRRACERHHGHAAPLFLEHLVTNRATAVAMVRERMERWLTTNLGSGSAGQVSRVAARFALIAAAGELATSWGILPWPADTANTAAAACFKAWLEHRGGTGPAEIREGLAQLRLFLEQYGTSRFEAAWEIDPADPTTGVINRAGFRRREVVTEDERTGARTYGPWEYYVLPEVWRREVCKGVDHKAIAKALAAQGGLVLGDGRNLPCNIRVPGLGLRRLMHVLPRAFSENASEQSEQSEQPGVEPVSADPTEKAKVGTVGTAGEIDWDCSDCSDHASSSRNGEDPNEINDVPTVPTVPTGFDTKHGGENDSDPNGASEDLTLTCVHCGRAFLRKSNTGRPPRYCSPKCRRTALAAKTPGYDPDESGDVVIDQ
jgi:putative DNA primase/helicase